MFSVVSNGVTRATLTGLEAYSSYQISIKGLDNNGESVEGLLDSVETHSDRPQVKLDKGQAAPYTQAIKFTWTPPQPQLDEATCQKQHGELDGFFVQLYGLDPWSPEGLIKQINLSDINTGLFYASQLKPFSSYKLKVYVRNRNGLYNAGLPLEINATTRPHIPEAPVETKAHPTTSESIHLRWQPHQPPTGSITKYKVRYGPLSEPMDWKAEKEVANETNYCSNMSKKFKFVCIEVHGLEANTTYLFQVQSFNADIAQGSDYSKPFKATTDPLKGQTQQIVSPTEPSTTNDFPLHPNNFVTKSSTTHLWVIIVSFVIIVILILVISALIYKIKKYKLKQKYQMQSHHHGRANGQSQPQSLDVSALGSYYPSMTTIDYSVAYHVRDIQARQLPAPPQPSQAIQEDLYENDPDLLANVNHRDPRSSTPKIRLSTVSRPLSEQVTSTTSAQIECTDLDGYLRPTFPERPPSSATVQLSDHATVIPTESYVSAVQLEAQQPRTISPVMTTESHPLISLSSPASTFI